MEGNPYWVWDCFENRSSGNACGSIPFPSAKKDAHICSSLDDFLAEEGILEECTKTAIERVSERHGMAEDEVTYGVRGKIELYVDAWQAYCAGEGLRANPYKRFSENWKDWKRIFLNARQADKKGLMPGGYKTGLAEKYHERHKEKSQ